MAARLDDQDLAAAYQARLDRTPWADVARQLGCCVQSAKRAVKRFREARDLPKPANDNIPQIPPAELPKAAAARCRGETWAVIGARYGIGRNRAEEAVSRYAKAAGIDLSLVTSPLRGLPQRVRDAKPEAVIERPVFPRHRPGSPRIRTCQYIAADPLKDPTMCGKPSTGGSSYCPYHHALCYDPPSEPQRRTQPRAGSSDAPLPPGRPGGPVLGQSVLDVVDVPRRQGPQGLVGGDGGGNGRGRGRGGQRDRHPLAAGEAPRGHDRAAAWR